MKTLDVHNMGRSAPVKVLLATGLCAAMSMQGPAAHADDKSACLEASLDGQTQRDARKLVEARDSFRACAREQCPGIVRKDCLGWLAAVEQDLPTVVLSAKDAGGHDLFAVKVTADGRVLVTRLDGQAVSMDPGSHALHFELDDETSVDAEVLVQQGEKNKSIAVVLKTTPVAASLPPVASETAVPPASPPAVDADTSAPKPRSGAWRTAAYFAGAAGVAGLGLGTFFGVQAMSSKSSADCVANRCDAMPLEQARRWATASTVAFVAGGALLGGGVALWVLAPRTEAKTAVRLAPLGAGGRLELQGSW
jgi:hypothetical protein